MTDLYTDNQIRAWFITPNNDRSPAKMAMIFDSWIAQHDAKVRLSVKDPIANDERVSRYLSMVTPLGYQGALTVVEAMTRLIESEKQYVGGRND